LLAVINVAAGANLTNQLAANIGSLRNRGVEAALNYGLIRSEDLTWDVNLNGAYNVNEITDLGPQLPGFLGYEVGGIPGGTGSTIQVQRVGSPSNAFFVRQQVYGPDGRPVQGLFVNRDGSDNVINNQDNYVYKQPAPLVTLGFSSNVAYKNLNLAVVLRGNLGNYIYNANASNNANFANAQGSTGFLTNLPSSVTSTGFTRQQLFSDYYVQNGSFLRAENITLGYSVGKLFNDRATLRITGNVQNAFLITKYDGVDPEIFGGIDNNFYPRARTFTLGVNIGI
jgi:iron complex outermembrane receptor protein